ncbi:hypothetical protein CMO94_02545 [Candidatus Woesearchaeota archaeon]|nr:hypothetical protein [Candidatus Woesearchaeota archaeon]
MEQAEEKLGKYTIQEVTQEEYKKRIEQLKEFGFPVESEPKFADFLVKHWGGTTQIVKYAGKSTNYLFQNGLLAVKDLIMENPWMWPGIIEMAKAARVFSSELFGIGLTPVKNLIRKNPWMWPGIIKITKAASDISIERDVRRSAYIVFRDLRNIEKITEKGNWPIIVEGFVEMINAIRDDGGKRYYFGMVYVKYIIDLSDVSMWPGIIKIGKAAGRDTSILFNYGLSTVNGKINEIGWDNIVKGFVEMAKAAGDDKKYLFKYGLPAVKDLIKKNPRIWPEIVEGFVEIINAVSGEKAFFLAFGLPAIKYIVKSEEDWKIYIKFVKSIASNRQKLSIFESMSKIPRSVLRAFSDFILIVMDKQPSHMINILKYIRTLTLYESSVSAEILQFAKIVRTFNLNPREYPSEKIKQNIRNTYIFLAQQTMKKNIEKNIIALDRDIEKLSNPNIEIRRATMDKISKIITPLIVEYIGHVTINKFEETWRSYVGIGINKDIGIKYLDDLSFALQIAMQNDNPEAKLFLEQVGLGNFYPEKKIPDCFPYDQPESLEFISEMKSKGIAMEPWIYGFEKILPVQSKEGAEHQAQLIEQNIKEVLQHFKELNVQTTKEHMEEDFIKIKDSPNQVVVQDIKQHLQTIKSLEGGIKTITSITNAKVYLELNPLKVLQMGERVSGSCLALDGGHGGDTITNAIDVNKRIAWAEHDGRILGRILLAMNEDGEILRYRIYYALTGIDLNITFNAFVQELAKACHTKTSTMEDVSLILASDWYAGSEAE